MSAGAGTEEQVDPFNLDLDGLAADLRERDLALITVTAAKSAWMLLIRPSRSSIGRLSSSKNDFFITMFFSFRFPQSSYPF